MIRIRRVTLVWLALVAATLISRGLSHGTRPDTRAAGIAVIIIAFIKIRYVILDFMELRTAPLGMRIGAEAWCIVVCSTLVILYAA
jgi:Prokaryotic Cytochrome C oxidase subunit IV